MMTFNAPTPRRCAGLSKNCNVIKISIACGGWSWGFAFDLVENLFEAHDGRGLHVAALAEAAIEQGMREQTLRRGHVFEGQTFARFGNEVPIESFFVLEFICGFGFLVGR